MSDVGVRITTTCSVDGQPLESEHRLHMDWLTGIPGAAQFFQSKDACQTILLLQSHVCFQIPHLILDVALERLSTPR